MLFVRLMLSDGNGVDSSAISVSLSVNHIDNALLERIFEKKTEPCKNFDNL